MELNADSLISAKLGDVLLQVCASVYVQASGLRGTLIMK